MDGIFCAEDELNAPVCCCFCRFPLSYVCSAHLYKHPTDTEVFQHFHLPLPARQFISTQELKDQWAPWLFRLHSAFQVLRRNDALLTHYDEQLEALRLEVAQQCQSEVEEARQLLHALKDAFAGELQRAVRAVSEHALEQWTPLDDPLSTLILRHESAQSLKLFRLQVEKSYQGNRLLKVSVETDLPSLAQFNRVIGREAELEPANSAIERQALAEENAQLRARVETLEGELTVMRIAQPRHIAPAILPQVLPEQLPVLRLTNRGIRLLDCQSTIWGAEVPLSTSIYCDKKSSYTLVDSTTVLVCGSNLHTDSCNHDSGWTSTVHSAYSQEAYLIHLGIHQHQVQTLPLMNKTRLAPGVVGYAGSAYAFGSDRIVGGETYAGGTSHRSAESVDCGVSATQL